MADRYRVGAGGNWSDTTKWSTTDNGSTGASAPTLTDNAIINSHASGTITIDGGLGSCLNLDCTGFAGTISIPVNTNLDVYGSLTSGTSTTWSIAALSTSAIRFQSTTGSATITANGRTLPPLNFNGVGGSWSHADAFTCRGLTVTNGTWTSNGKNFTADAFNSNNSNLRSITLDGSAVILNSTGTVSSISTTTNLTFSAVGTTITISDVSASTKTLNWGTITVGTLTIPASGGAITITGPADATRTVGTLNITGPKTINLGSSARSPMAVTTALNFNGSSGNQILFQSNSTDSQFYPKGCTQSITFTTFTNIKANAFNTVNAKGTGNVNGGGNSNVQFAKTKQLAAAGAG